MRMMNLGHIALLGGGNMGRALIGGLLRRGVASDALCVAETFAATREALERDFSIATHADSAAAVARANLVIVAVKPQDTSTVLLPLAEILRKNGALVLSIAAGIRVQALERWSTVHVVRAMPNRPALVGAGVTGLYAGQGVTAQERASAQGVMQAVGETLWVQEEDQLDVVTALSGSGPAYCFLLAEAMAEAAVGLGLPRDAAYRLAQETLYGAGMMAHGEAIDLAQLRVSVTSKGGTTEAALNKFEAEDFRGMVARALTAATRRGRELGS